MKPAEAKEVYVECCRQKLRTAERGEAEQWAKEFAFFERVDVLAGFESWCRDTTPTGNGQPRGKFWPQTLELKPHIQAAQRSRYGRVSSNLDLVAWKCPDCGYGMMGWPSEPNKPRFCPNWRSSRAPQGSPNWRGVEGVCGQRMEIHYRESPRASEAVA